MKDRAETLVQGRREKLASLLGRSFSPPGASDRPLRPESLEHLVGEGQDLYWNDLEWEHLTDEEKLDDGAVVQLTFPGFLAFVRGLLLEEAMPDALAPADPRPEVAERLLLFLARRVLELDEGLAEGSTEERDQMLSERSLADGLIDLVLHLVHRLSASEVETLERAQSRG